MMQRMDISVQTPKLDLFAGVIIMTNCTSGVHGGGFNCRPLATQWMWQQQSSVVVGQVDQPLCLWF
jgi:hypothetical protein